MIKDYMIYLKKTVCVVYLKMIYLNKHLISLLFVMYLNKKALLNKFN